MTEESPKIYALSGRAFAASAASIGALLIDNQERFLMLANPKRPGQWEPPNGAFEANETLLEAVQREIAEEAGPDVRARPLCVLHASTFRYDAKLQHVISVFFLFVYEGGNIEPGDDMAGSEVRWFTLEEIESGEYNIVAPRKPTWWVFRHALEMYRLLKDRPPFDLQPAADATFKNKYGE